MSPLSLRRFRAERLLREDFADLRSGVLAVVRGRLAARGVHLDGADLEACYAAAWQALYGTILNGHEVQAPAAWLTVVTFRRALDEHRTTARSTDLDEIADAPAPERDLAAELDDRRRIAELVEALRGRLDAREREAAALCYVHGFSRSEAARRMGISERRMRKLMDGRSDRPGVAAKVSALVQAVAAGGWCEEQRSSMRALAFGMLDPEGERYRLASDHRRRCPACRAYVLSLRGLAAALPVPLLPGVLAAGRAALPGVLGSARAHVLAGGHGPGTAAGAGAVAPAVGAAGSGTATGAGGGAGAGTGSGLGAGAAGAAGGGAGSGAGAGAGGSFAFVGAPLGGKLALVCLLAAGIGAGCVALVPGGRPAQRAHGRGADGPAHGGTVAAEIDPAAGDRVAGGLARALAAVSAARAGHALPRLAGAPPDAGAAAEFGPERELSHAARPLSLRAVSALAGSVRPAGAPARGGDSAGAVGGAAATLAEREFGPG
jgi:RNA polymerase sigma factor (sigma-70 family)